MGFLMTLFIGLIAGVIAKFLHPGKNEPKGFLLTMLLGVVGAAVLGLVMGVVPDARLLWRR